MKTSRLALPFVLIMALIAYVDGGFSLLTAWNCLPLAAGFCALALGLRVRGILAIALLTFSVLATLISALFHLAGLFHWAGMARESPPSEFIIVPLLAIGLPFAIAVVACLVVASFRYNDNTDLRKQ